MSKLQAMVKRLKSNKGESISEVLIALLVSALAIILLAGMINASTEMIQKSKAKMDKYVDAENGIVEQSADDPDTGSVTVVQGNGASPVKLTDDAPDAGIQVEYYTNSESGKNTVRSYKVK